MRIDTSKWARWATLHHFEQSPCSSLLYSSACNHSRASSYTIIESDISGLKPVVLAAVFPSATFVAEALLFQNTSPHFLLVQRDSLALTFSYQYLRRRQLHISESEQLLTVAPNEELKPIQACVGSNVVEAGNRDLGRGNWFLRQQRL